MRRIVIAVPVLAAVLLGAALAGSDSAIRRTTNGFIGGEIEWAGGLSWQGRAWSALSPIF